MQIVISARKHHLMALSVFALLLAALCCVGAAQELESKREGLLIQEVPVVVDYATAASAEDLKLPFYSGAEVVNSFSYTVTTRENELVVSYSSALLTSSDAPERVAQAYTELLPGAPPAERVEGEAGARYVIALSVDGEVRVVAITAHESGSRIQLIRASEPKPPPAMSEPRQPRIPPRPLEPGPRRYRGRGGLA